MHGIVQNLMITVTILNYGNCVTCAHVELRLKSSHSMLRFLQFLQGCVDVVRRDLGVPAKGDLQNSIVYKDVLFL